MCRAGVAMLCAASSGCKPSADYQPRSLGSAAAGPRAASTECPGDFPSWLGKKAGVRQVLCLCASGDGGGHARTVCSKRERGGEGVRRISWRARRDFSREREIREEQDGQLRHMDMSQGIIERLSGQTEGHLAWDGVKAWVRRLVRITTAGGVVGSAASGVHHHHGHLCHCGSSGCVTASHPCSKHCPQLPQLLHASTAHFMSQHQSIMRKPLSNLPRLQVRQLTPLEPAKASNWTTDHAVGCPSQEPPLPCHSADQKCHQCFGECRH